MKLYPKCHPYWYDEEIPVKFRRQRAVSYTASGYMMPCCWCDQIDMSEFKKLGMLDEELKLENNSSVKQIMLSKQWVSFHKMLIENPENSPTVCKRKCSDRPKEDGSEGLDYDE